VLHFKLYNLREVKKNPQPLNILQSPTETNVTAKTEIKTISESSF